MFSPCSAKRRASDKDLPVFLDFPWDISYLFWFDHLFFFQEESSGRKESSPTGKSSSGSESPKPGRRRFGSTADEIDVTKLNGMAENAINNATSSGGTTATNAELEAMKQEILREMRKEMAKMKQDIIEGTFRIRKIFLPQLTLRT